MSLIAVAFVVCSALYTGFQWTIRVVVYPQFLRVASEDFAEYERWHQRQVSIAVAPLFLAVGVSGLGLLAHRPALTPIWIPLVVVGLVSVLLGITAVAAVPLHRRLAHGFDADVHRRLLLIDSARLVVSVGFTSLGVYILLR